MSWIWREADCPTCHAVIGNPCHTHTGRPTHAHAARHHLALDLILAAGELDTPPPPPTRHYRTVYLPGDAPTR